MFNSELFNYYYNYYRFLYYYGTGTFTPFPLPIPSVPLNEINVPINTVTQSLVSRSSQFPNQIVSDDPPSVVNSHSEALNHDDDRSVPKQKTYAQISQLSIPKNTQSSEDSASRITSRVMSPSPSSARGDHKENLIVKNERRMMSEVKDNDDSHLNNSLEKLFNVKVMNEKDADSVVKVMNHLRDSIIQFYIKKIHVHSMESSEFNDLASQLSMITSKLLHHSLSESNGTVNQNESKETNIIRNETVDAKEDHNSDQQKIKKELIYYKNDSVLDIIEKLRINKEFQIIWGFKSEGPQHSLTWNANLKVDDRNFVGIGKNKRNAKFNAAKVALKELKNNPIIELLRTFKYMIFWGDFKSEGPDRSLIWKISLKIDDRFFVGIGKTKKNAKINAAEMALKEFENVYTK